MIEHSLPLHSVSPQEVRDYKDSRASRHEADMGPDPRRVGPQHQPPQPPRRPFTRDGNAPRPHADSTGHYHNRSMDHGAEHVTHPRSQHMGPPDARDADMSSHGPAVSGRNPLNTHLTYDNPPRGYSRPRNDEGHLHMHPDAERAQHGRSGSHGRYADRVPGSSARTDKTDGPERRAGSRSDMGTPPARLEARQQHISQSRPRHHQREDLADVVAPPR